MSHFVPAAPFECEFDGDTVRCTLKPLKRKHMSVLAPLLSKVNEGKAEGETVTLDVSDGMRLAAAGGKILPQCVEKLEGLSIGGEPADLKDILEEQYFSGLIIQLVTELIVRSNPGMAEKKALSEPPPDSEAALLPAPEPT